MTNAKNVATAGVIQLITKTIPLVPFLLVVVEFTISVHKRIFFNLIEEIPDICFKVSNNF